MGMKKVRWALLLSMMLLAAGYVLTLGAHASEGSPAGKPVVVVELFTSEGCSSCPPADEVLRELRARGSEGADLVLLGEHVDYWDHQGWRDRFSSPLFSGRQAKYSARLNVPAYTPQAVIDGRVELIGSDGAGMRSAIASAAHRNKTFHLQMSWDARTQTATIAGDGSGSEELMLAVTEDELRSNVQAGENSGNILQHTAVVRSLTDTGEVHGRFQKQVKVNLDPAWNPRKLRVVAFVQSHETAAIDGATAAKLVP